MLKVICMEIVVMIRVITYVLEGNRRNIRVLMVLCGIAVSINVIGKTTLVLNDAVITIIYVSCNA